MSVYVQATRTYLVRSPAHDERRDNHRRHTQRLDLGPDLGVTILPLDLSLHTLDLTLAQW